MKLDFIIDSAPVTARLQAVRAVVADMRPVMGRIGAALVMRVKGYFRDGMDPYGTRWEPLKARRGQPLVDTGRLRNSIAFSADKASVTVGTNVQYAPPHQFGATFKPRGQVNAHGRTGRFLSRQAASARRGSVRVSFAKFKERVLPARPFLPTRTLPAPWAKDIREQLKVRLTEVTR